MNELPSDPVRRVLYLLTANNAIYLTLLARLGVRNRVLYPIPFSERL